MKIVYIGKILRPHGLKGKVIIYTFADDQKTLKPDIQVLIDPEGDSLALSIESVSQHTGGIMVGFKGITDRSEAEKLSNKFIAVNESQLNGLAENEYYAFELIGCSVKTAGGMIEGVVEEVVNNPGNDLLQIKKGDKAFYIPLVKALIKNIDIHKREIIIDDLKGLLE